MPTITKRFCTNNSRYKANQKLNPVGVVLHSIGCPQPDANVLQRSWQNNVSPYVTHYVLDGEKILQCMPNDRKCWHAGSPGNAKWLGVEMCEPKQIKYTSGAKFTVSDKAAARAYCEKTYKNAVWLLAKLCKEYGWNPQTAILTHCEVTKRKLSKTDHVDPEHLWNGLGMAYSLEKLRKDVAFAMGKTTASATTNTATAPSAPTSKNATEAAKSFRSSLSGTYKVTASALNVRGGAGASKPILTTIPRDTAVKNYGYYTTVGGVKWLYVMFKHKGVSYVGFASSEYLKK